MCTCVLGWTGVNCETDINECTSNPCQNGAQCRDLLNRYECQCLPGWEGVNCDVGKTIITYMRILKLSSQLSSNLMFYIDEFIIANAESLTNGMIQSSEGDCRQYFNTHN